MHLISILPSFIRKSLIKPWEKRSRWIELLAHLMNPLYRPPVFGIIGLWRLIFHLSAPPSSSINDSIDTIDDAINLLQQLGPNALMAKADLKSAFRLCPVHPLDWPLLGIQWRNQYFIDKCLPFGLQSSPYLFNLVADAPMVPSPPLYGVNASFHYLDHFFFAGPSRVRRLPLGHHQLSIPLLPTGCPAKARETGVPYTTTMTFLGIQLDAAQQVASLYLWTSSQPSSHLSVNIFNSTGMGPLSPSGPSSPSLGNYLL